MENMREFFRSVGVGLQVLDSKNMFSSVLECKAARSHRVHSFSFLHANSFCNRLSRPDFPFCILLGDLQKP